MESLSKPIDIPTRETASFVASRLASGATVLEVGCGDGYVAEELVRRGLSVVGLDSDEAAVERARGRGVNAIRASWPNFQDVCMDAVAFTRSLHHISPIEEAVSKARGLLKPNGLLLVEDFAFDEVDEATIAWFVDMLYERRSLITPVPGEFATEILESKDPVVAWRHDHDHELHTIGTMRSAISQQFELQQTESVPYLYRYLVPVLPETPDGARCIQEVLREEARGGAQGQVVLIGRRMTGRKHVGDSR